jgi:hypothetical protein
MLTCEHEFTKQAVEELTKRGDTHCPVRDPLPRAPDGDDDDDDDVDDDDGGNRRSPLMMHT